MVKELEEKNGRTVISQGPCNPFEMINWYDTCYHESLVLYEQILKDVISIDRVQCIFSVCLGEYVNKLQLKQFPAVFFTENHISTLKPDFVFDTWKSNTYMIAFFEVSFENINFLFSDKTGASCLYFHTDEDLHEEIKSYFFPRNKTEILFSNYAKRNNYFIEYNSVGCDGNSLIIHHGDNPLIKQIIANQLTE